MANVNSNMQNTNAIVKRNVFDFLSRNLMKTILRNTYMEANRLKKRKKAIKEGNPLKYNGNHKTTNRQAFFKLCLVVPRFLT